jgi:hypothetical protein
VLPSPNSQDQEAAPVEASVNATASGASPLVTFAVKPATGAEPGRVRRSTFSSTTYIEFSTVGRSRDPNWPCRRTRISRSPTVDVAFQAFLELRGVIGPDAVVEPPP